MLRNQPKVPAAWPLPPSPLSLVCGFSSFPAHRARLYCGPICNRFPLQPVPSTLGLLPDCTSEHFPLWGEVGVKFPTLKEQEGRRVERSTDTKHCTARMQVENGCSRQLKSGSGPCGGRALTPLCVTCSSPGRRKCPALATLCCYLVASW